ncbi:type III pantothenate kinase [Synechococcus sp. PCC 7336]|uniref:type III pantothenate kinase n=1 Tax=Synechococcus sp. PCC 7336 TaxID=195250 RepID=UPI001D0D6EF7|nr:type III pantothenate kinase [Synechococcus sp. PCC 7336]
MGQSDRLQNRQRCQVHHLTLAEVPLAGTYETLGLDRALALVGAARRVGWPVLAVDGGTALTISAADAAGRFAGGAIWPGLSLQGRSLHQATAALPLVTFEHSQLPLPERWATSTGDAICSGILYSAIAAVRDYCLDWRLRYPNSPIAFLGGDGQLLQQALALGNSYCDPTLVLQGIAACRELNRTERGGFEPPNGLTR